MMMNVFLLLIVVGMSSGTPALASFFMIGEGGFSAVTELNQEDYKDALFNPRQTGKYESRSGFGCGRVAGGYISPIPKNGLLGLVSLASKASGSKVWVWGFELGVGYYSYTTLSFESTDGLNYKYRQDTSGTDGLLFFGRRFGTNAFTILKFGMNSLRMTSKVNAALAAIEGGEKVNTATTQMAPMIGLSTGLTYGKNKNVGVTFSAYHIPGKSSVFGKTEAGETPAFVNAELKVPAVTALILGIMYEFKL